ncbi:MAM and LDL-receptor class A domain-containing protein 1-like [Haliotis rufescens]|uniref:MAM and LDL-receptor class A domain-containing protein 1-like n=1 Tax=Haliotis rufescens TaxID=6454 RepID=UPI00201EE9ED|nr:MAM and LDL-receptor class A domain-containing protein 1-like [Haliotis rufescens]
MATTTTTTTPVIINYHTTYCDFEDNDNCGYNQSSRGVSKWYRGEGKLSSLTGPVSDHTLGTPSGVYMYIDAYKSAQWYAPQTVSALLESPVFAPSSSYCLRFWYNMFGANIEDLHVYVKVGGGLGNPVWTRSKGNSIMWLMGQVDLDSEYTSRPFHIVFEATSRSYMTKPTSTYKYDPVYHDTKGDIAIDDVLAYNTTCKNLPECPPGSLLRTGNDSRSCYTFHTSAAFWFRGHVKCKEENARSHLVAINSKEEQDFLVNIIKRDAALTAAGTAGFFTSGNDETMEKHFQWTGAEISNNATYTNWYPGQPNNVGAMQHCLLMEYPNADYQWGDVECDTAHPYICEVDLPNATHQPGPSL